jgi:hypothetical protein
MRCWRNDPSPEALQLSSVRRRGRPRIRQRILLLAALLIPAGTAFGQERLTESTLAGVTLPEASRSWTDDPEGAKAATLDLASSLTSRTCGPTESHFWRAISETPDDIRDKTDTAFTAAGWTLDTISRGAEGERTHLAHRGSDELIMSWMPTEGGIGLLLCQVAGRRVVDSDLLPDLSQMRLGANEAPADADADASPEDGAPVPPEAPDAASPELAPDAGLPGEENPEPDVAQAEPPAQAEDVPADPSAAPSPAPPAKDTDRVPQSDGAAPPPSVEPAAPPAPSEPAAPPAAAVEAPPATPAVAEPAAAAAASGSGIGWIVRLVTLLLGTAAFAGAAFLLVRQGLANRRQGSVAATARWPKALAMVLSSRVDVVQHVDAAGQETIRFRPNVDYEFEVGGKVYRSDCYHLGNPGEIDRAVAERQVQALPRGAAIEISFDPLNPANATIATDAPGPDLPLVLGGAAALASLACLVAALATL